MTIGGGDSHARSDSHPVVPSVGINNNNTQWASERLSTTKHEGNLLGRKTATKHSTSVPPHGAPLFAAGPHRDCFGVFRSNSIVLRRSVLSGVVRPRGDTEGLGTLSPRPRRSPRRGRGISMPSTLGILSRPARQTQAASGGVPRPWDPSALKGDRGAEGLGTRAAPRRTCFSLPGHVPTRRSAPQKIIAARRVRPVAQATLSLRGIRKVDPPPPSMQWTGSYCLFGVNPSIMLGSKIEACNPPRMT